MDERIAEVERRVFRLEEMMRLLVAALPEDGWSVQTWGGFGNGIGEQEIAQLKAMSPPADAVSSSDG